MAKFKKKKKKMNFGYKKIMQANSRDVHNAAISTKIIQLMDKIRDYGTDEQARRWVRELIQNAKDAAYTDKLVKIKIEFFNDKIIFSHNGRPFLVKNILSIINQKFIFNMLECLSNGSVKPEINDVLLKIL